MKYYNNNVQWCFSKTFYDFAILCWCQRKIRNWNTKSTVTWYNVLDWLNAKKVTKHVQTGLYNASVVKYTRMTMEMCLCYTLPMFHTTTKLYKVWCMRMSRNIKFSLRVRVIYQNLKYSGINIPLRKLFHTIKHLGLFAGAEQVDESNP